MNLRAGRFGVWAATALLVAGVFVQLEAPASARHNFSMLKANPESAVAGGEVSVTGFSYPANTKVTVRLNALDGPVLAELEPTANQDIRGTVRIPPDTPPGPHVLYAVQHDATGRPNRIPGRAAVTVMGPGAPAAGEVTGLDLESRPAGLVETDGASVGQLVLAALAGFGGAAVLSLLMARLVVSGPATSAKAPAR